MNQAPEVEKFVKTSEDKMKVAFEAVQRQFSTIRTGRAHPSIVESIKVDYYGVQTPIKQLGSITTPEPRMLVISPWDRSSLQLIEKAIQISDLGVSPVNDGKVIRLGMPQLTTERREEMIKVLHKIAEEGKVSIRTARHTANEDSVKFEKDGKLTEDEKFAAKDRVQKLTDSYTGKIDTLLADKVKEIMN